METEFIRTRFERLSAFYVALLLSIIIAGIVIFNRDFVHLGFRHIYITEFLLLNILMIVGTFPRFSKQVCAKKNSFLLAFILYGLAQLVLNSTLDFDALRHCLINLYGVFLFVFVFIFDEKNRLKKFLILFLILSTFINGFKIACCFFSHKVYAGELFRVSHNEVDVICAALSLIGLMIFSEEFLKKSRTLYISSFLINVMILIFTVKRSALLGLLLVLVLLVTFKRNKFFHRHLFLIVFFLSFMVLTGFVGLYFHSQSTFYHLFDFILGKLDYTRESGSAWRLTAWNLGWKEFLNAPWLGAGYGRPIIAQSINFTTTQDPHNSFLALLIRNGIAGTGLFVLLLIQSLSSSLRLFFSPTKKELAPFALFFMLGLVFMLNFAFFNVVLENQYEGIFFWFMLSGPFILNSWENGNSPTQAATKTNTFTRLAVGLSLVLIMVYAALCFSPWNTIERICIYDAKRGAQIPNINRERTTKITTLQNTEAGLEVRSLSDREGWSTLYWVLPEETHKLKKVYSKYVLHIAFKGTIPYYPSFTIYGKYGEEYPLKNLVIREDDILYYFRNSPEINWDSVLILKMDLPSDKHAIQFTINKLEVNREDSLSLN